MAKRASVFDDLSKVGSSLLANMVNIKNELSQMIAQQIKVALMNLDFVSKKDFDALKTTVAALQKQSQSMAKSSERAKPEPKPKTKIQAKKPASKASAKKIKNI